VTSINVAQFSSFTSEPVSAIAPPTDNTTSLAVEMSNTPEVQAYVQLASGPLTYLVPTDAAMTNWTFQYGAMNSTTMLNHVFDGLLTIDVLIALNGSTITAWSGETFTVTVFYLDANGNQVAPPSSRARRTTPSGTWRVEIGNDRYRSILFHNSGHATSKDMIWVVESVVTKAMSVTSGVEDSIGSYNCSNCMHLTSGQCIHSQTRMCAPYSTADNAGNESCYPAFLRCSDGTVGTFGVVTETTDPPDDGSSNSNSRSDLFGKLSDIVIVLLCFLAAAILLLCCVTMVMCRTNAFRRRMTEKQVLKQVRGINYYIDDEMYAQINDDHQQQHMGPHNYVGSGGHQISSTRASGGRIKMTPLGLARRDEAESSGMPQFQPYDDVDEEEVHSRTRLSNASSTASGSGGAGGGGANEFNKDDDNAAAAIQLGQKWHVNMFDLAASGRLLKSTDSVDSKESKIHQFSTYEWDNSDVHEMVAHHQLSPFARPALSPYGGEDDADVGADYNERVVGREFNLWPAHVGDFSDGVGGGIAEVNRASERYLTNLTTSETDYNMAIVVDHNPGDWSINADGVDGAVVSPRKPAGAHPNRLVQQQPSERVYEMAVEQALESKYEMASEQAPESEYEMASEQAPESEYEMASEQHQPRQGVAYEMPSVQGPESEYEMASEQEVTPRYEESAYEMASEQAPQSEYEMASSQGPSEYAMARKDSDAIYAESEDNRRFKSNPTRLASAMSSERPSELDPDEVHNYEEILSSMFGSRPNGTSAAAGGGGGGGGGFPNDNETGGVSYLQMPAVSETHSRAMGEDYLGIDHSVDGVALTESDIVPEGLLGWDDERKIPLLDSLPSISKRSEIDEYFGDECDGGGGAQDRDAKAKFYD
jgi:hypothetical protein